MAINIFCPGCKNSNKLKAERCSKCGLPFGHSKKYRVFVSVKGRNPITKVVENLTLARKVETAIKTDLMRGDLDIDQKPQVVPTLNEVWAKYLPFAKEHKKTWDDDLFNYQKHLEPRFGRKRLDTISPFDVEKLKIEMKRGLNKNRKPYTDATIKHQLVLLKRLYHKAMEWGYSGEIPVKREHIPRLDNQVTEYFKVDELARLHQTLDNWPCKDSVAFIRFALYTGFRKGEIFKLTWDDINFEWSMVTIRQPKGGKTEIIRISKEALDVLKGLERLSSPYVFPGNNGQQRTDFKGPWKRIRKAAGLPDNFRFHGLRHNFASYLVAEYGLEVVGKLLTHKDPRTTQRYAHLLEGVMKEAALRSGELLSQRSDPHVTVVRFSQEGND